MFDFGTRGQGVYVFAFNKCTDRLHYWRILPNNTLADHAVRLLDAIDASAFFAIVSWLELMGLSRPVEELSIEALQLIRGVTRKDRAWHRQHPEGYYPIAISRGLPFDLDEMVPQFEPERVRVCDGDLFLSFTKAYPCGMSGLGLN